MTEENTTIEKTIIAEKTIAEKVYKEFKNNEGIYFDFDIKRAIWRAIELQMTADFEIIPFGIHDEIDEIKKELEKIKKKIKEIV